MLQERFGNNLAIVDGDNVTLSSSASLGFVGGMAS